MLELFPKDILSQIEFSLSEGLTQSEIMLRQNCARKWYFRYVRMLKKKGSFSWALLWGDAIHKMLEAYYTSVAKNTPDVWNITCGVCPNFKYPDDVLLMPGQQEEELYWKKLAEIYARHYIKYWATLDSNFTVHDVERKISLKYKGFTLKGKIDLLLTEIGRQSIWLMDHKTTYDFNEHLTAGWRFRFQFLFYAWIYWKITKIYPAGIYVNAIKKPAERRSKANQESLEEFLDRIDNNIRAEPDKYFHRERLPFDKHILPRFEELTLKPIIMQYELIEGSIHTTASEWKDSDYTDIIDCLLLSMNSDHCHVYNRPCEYLDLCQNAFNDFSEEYITTNIKHEELQK